MSRRAPLARWLLAGALATGLAVPGRAFEERAAREREEALGALELPPMALERHLVAEQRLVVWLPPGFTEAQQTGSRSFRLVRESDGTELRLARVESQPGASVLQLAEMTLNQLRRANEVGEVHSVRRLRIGSVPAVEMVASGPQSEPPRQLRLAVMAGRQDDHHRVLLLIGQDRDGAPLDVAWSLLLRDVTPLERGVWSATFERLRRAQIADETASAAWDRRNRLLAEIAQPDAVGQPWVEERLASLAAAGQAPLLDGLLHSHPRVRMAVQAALDLESLSDPDGRRLLGTAARDADPAVRYRLALRLAAVPGLTAGVLERVLDDDSEMARSAALQLAVVLPAGERGDLVLDAFSRRDQLPVRNAAFLATLLARWGPSPAVERALLQAYRTSRDTPLRRAALGALLERGVRDALVVARERLRSPGEPGLVSLPRAACALAVHSVTSDVSALRPLSDGVAAAAGEARSEVATLSATGPADEPARVAALRRMRELGESSRTLSEVLGHLESLGEGGETADECHLLNVRSPSEWVDRRRVRLGCPPQRSAVFARLSLPRPGGFASALLDLLGRLEIASPAHREVFQAAIDRLASRMEEWGGDPLSMTSTGFDLSAPGDLAWWPAAGGSAGDTPGGIRLKLRAQDRERAVDTLLRLAEGGGDLEDYAYGLFLVQGLPLLPATLVGLWESERSARQGEGEARTRESPERHAALGAAGADGEEAAARLFEVTIADDGEVEWAATDLSTEGSSLVLTTWSDQGPEAWDPAPPPPAGELAATLELDLSATLRRLAEEQGDEGDRAAVPDQLTLRARTDPGNGRLATRFELAGLPESWLASIVDGPAEEQRAPAELLPASTAIWLIATFDSTALSAALAGESPRLVELIGESGRDRLLAATAILRGEAGLAVVGVPEPTGDDAGAAWRSRLVGFARVEPAAADRYLAHSIGKGETVDGLRLHRFEGGVATRLGGYLVVAAEPEALRGLCRGPFLAETPSFREMMARTPVAAALRAGFATDLVAETVRQSAAARGDETGTILGVEALRALGTIAAWARRETRALVGEVSATPRLAPADGGWRRDAAGASYVRGSVGVDGLAPRAIAGPREELELELRLPAGVADPGFAWEHERLSQERLPDGAYRWVSRRGVALPESSPSTLPLGGAELAPFLRNEQDLDLHLGALRELGERIRGEETDPARIVRAIVDWAHESLEYTVIRRETSVEKILATRRADCTEFTRLTIALARSLGIPARAVNGLHVGNEVAILHRWAEVYLDRWYEIDPTFGVVEVPAENVRIPQVDGDFLTNLPGSRLATTTIRAGREEWSRRIGSARAAARGETGIAVDGERVLAVYPGLDGSSHSLLSEDGGATFHDLGEDGLEGQLLSLIGGHGRLLRLHRLVPAADSSRSNTGAEAAPEVSRAASGAPIAVYELSSAGRWRRLALPEPLTGLAASGTLQLGSTGDGYLALGLTDSPRLWRVDAALDAAAEIPMPSSEAGEWLLATAGSALAHTAPGRGSTIHRGQDGDWLPAVSLDDSDRLAVKAMLVGERLAVEGEATTLDGSTRVRIVVAGGEQTWQTLPAGSEATTVADGVAWSVGRAFSGALVLTRRSW